MRFKKNGTLAVADLALSLIRDRISQIERSGELPDEAQYTFDELDRPTGFSDEITHEQAQAPATVRKTTRRTVVTLEYGTFEARHVIRQTKAQDGQSRPVPSAELARLVAPGCQYGYDLVAQLGLESFLHGRRLEEIQKDLQQGSPSIRVPASSLDELRRRFLFYLGQVHRRAAGDVLNVTYRYRSVFVPDWIAFDGVIIPRSEPDGEHEVSFEQKRTEATKLRCLRSLLFKTYFRVTDVSLLGEPQGRCSPEQNRPANLDEHSSVPVLFQDCR